jgi:hypothetical protein
MACQSGKITTFGPPIIPGGIGAGGPGRVNLHTISRSGRGVRMGERGRTDPAVLHSFLFFHYRYLHCIYTWVSVGFS